MVRFVTTRQKFLVDMLLFNFRNRFAISRGKSTCVDSIVPSIGVHLKRMSTVRDARGYQI